MECTGSAQGRPARDAITLPATSVAPVERAAVSPLLATHRKPTIVSAQVAPLNAARKFPRAGFGALANDGSTPTKNSDKPSVSAAMNSTSLRRTGSCNHHGPSSRIYSGAVDCRKIVFAAVVNLLPATNTIIVDAYAAPTMTGRHVQRLRASGSISSNASAAIAERKLATCQLDSVHALMPAPPVEKRTAAPKSCKRGTGAEDIELSRATRNTPAVPIAIECGAPRNHGAVDRCVRDE